MPTRYIKGGLAATIMLSGSAIADCACTGLEVKYNTQADSAAQSTEYCVVDTQTFGECTEVAANPCGAGMKTFTCPIGGKSGTDTEGDWFGVGLEYIITGTDLDSCTRGLALQRTLTEDGVAQANDPTTYTAPVGDVTFDTLNANIRSGDTNNIPAVGTTDGGQTILVSDNYAELSDEQTIRMNAAGTEIVFSDMPSVYLEAGDDAKDIVQQDVFVALVRNGAGDAAALCGCQFELTPTKDAGGTTLSSVTLTEGAKQNCTFTVVP
jgi:hypothetical protein